eukprot:3493068-Prymnesium_polylepis.4
MSQQLCSHLLEGFELKVDCTEPFNHRLPGMEDFVQGDRRETRCVRVHLQGARLFEKRERRSALGRLGLTEQDAGALAPHSSRHLAKTLRAERECVS